MTVRTATLFTKMWICLAFASLAAAQDLPATTPELGAFGFPDLSGTLLLVISDLVQLGQIKTALCTGARRVSIEFERRQEGLGGGGRDAPNNFDAVAWIIHERNSVERMRAAFSANGAECKRARGIAPGETPCES